MFSKKSSTSKPKFLNLHTLAPITVAVLAVYSSAASADYVLKDGVSLTGTDPTVDIYHTDKNLTLTNSSGAALDKVGVEALATADFTFASNGKDGLKDVSIQGFNGSGSLTITNTQGNALESNYEISGFERIKIHGNTYGLQASNKNHISAKNIFIQATEGSAVHFHAANNSTITIDNFNKLDVTSEKNDAIRFESSGNSELNINGTSGSIINIKSSTLAPIAFRDGKTSNLNIKGSIVNIEGYSKINMLMDSHLSITADRITFTNNNVNTFSSAIAGSLNSTISLNASKISTNDDLNIKYSTLHIGAHGKTTIIEMNDGSNFTANQISGGNIIFQFDELDINKINSPAFNKNGPYFSLYMPTNESPITADSVTITFNAEAIDALSDQQALDALSKAVDLKNLEKNEKSDLQIIGNGTTRILYTDENGGWTRVGASDITQQTIDLAAESLVAWRNETTTITDRLAALRGNTADYGAWVRWNGGAYKYDGRGMKNEFNTIEAGGDIKVSDHWLLGASFSYTEGEGTLDAGTADSDTYAGSFYALWTGQKGSFVDMVVKAGRLNTDFDLANHDGGGYDEGSIDRTGFILGIETGHRFALPANFFVEPQVQFIYSRLSSVDEVTAKRRVEIESSDSLIGRVGVMAGLNCPNDRGTVWVKASALRDFRGDVDGVSAMADGKAPFAFHEELDQNWAELALGADFKVSDNFYAFVDAQKSFGGDIELDWRANVGARFVW